MSIGAGVHGFYPQRTKMQTVWFVSGPGVASGREISGIRQIDIAPTLARLLGIPPPRNAQGHVIGEVFVARAGETQR
jgi:arylsulfatase A-like enzyme